MSHWRRWKLLIQGLESKNSYNVRAAKLQYYLGLVAQGRLTNDSFESLQQSAKEALYDVIGALRPWEGSSYTRRKADEFKDARQQYIDAFGVDPLDPEFKAWEQEAVKQLAEPEDAVESDEDRVTRLLRERTMK